MPIPRTQAPPLERLARALGLVSAAALLLGSGAAHAQVDVFPPRDNVLLLVDTSGSMEYQFDGSEVTCNAGNEAATNDRSRWVHVVEALTGTIQGYSCQTIDRSDPALFAKNGEYAYNTSDAYDYKYPIPFHRPLSNDCAVRPGNLPGSNPFIYPANAVSARLYNGADTCPFAQDSDGVLDAFGSGVRFGLMTFDSLTDAGTGTDGVSGPANYITGVNGTWSYFPGFRTSNANRATGAAKECAVTDQEVGARNGAAPPWEGRMVNFGNPDRGADAHIEKAEQIQEILLSTRPFGATPIAGMLRDAETFFFEDDSPDYDPEGTDYGPMNDPYVLGGCRDQFIVLITDGYPNLDLRPYCEDHADCDNQSDPDCRCPFDKPEEIAYRLANASGRPSVPVYVIAMALDQVTYNGDTVTCSSLSEETLDTACSSTAAADLANRELQACCSLQRIAQEGKRPGDTSEMAGKAHFVDTPEELRTALNFILSANIDPSSRTQPVFSGAGGSVRGSQRFYTSYEPIEFRPWRGHIERERYLCEDLNPADSTPPEPVAQPVSPDDGDDFAANLNSRLGPPRRFYTVLGGRTVSDTIRSRATIRPYIASDSAPDGLSTYGGRVVTGTDADTSFTDAVPPEAMEVADSSCPSSDENVCRDRYLKWLIGQDNGTSDWQRCETAGDPDCSLLGDVMRSTPRVVNRPLATLRDETYSAFAFTYATRPAVLYTSTNDGFLHAFKTLSNDPADVEAGDEALVLTKTNNELWGFIPPAILPEIDSIYPSNHQLLLDGAPVVKDVVAVVDDEDPDKITFARSREAAQAGNTSWRTVLVQSFGSARSGYFAIDITQPVPDSDHPETLSLGGPRFLWQLTLDGSHNTESGRLFGKGGATPLITTLFFDDGGGNGASEIAVAVLPGGPGNQGSTAGGGCDAELPSDVPIEAAFRPRDRIRCYDDEYPGAHSLTIVRLDNGEILRTFRRSADEMHPDIQAVKSGALIAETPLTSPITGQPVAFPSDVGAVADRIFVGDADGRVWKVDVSGDSPSEWTMSLFFDAYPAQMNGEDGHGFADGQPIQTPPILSVDDLGQLTVAVSTGDQDTGGTASTMSNYVWSLTEDVSDDKQSFETKVNWYKHLENGERVTGPMSLFSGTLYFSSFAPPAGSASVCASGSSKLWAMHYLEPNGEIDEGGLPTVLKEQPSDSDFVQFLEFENLIPGGDENVKPVVFGVTIAQLPTCFEDTVADDEDWLGYGSHTAMSEINPGKFELVVHTGQAGDNIPGGVTNVFKMDLPTPPALTSIDSWAAIVE